VGINTTTPDASSVLDVNSTEKGVLVPRMTQTQRTNITDPATGLLVYQTDNTDGFWYFDGDAWVSLNSSADTDWIASGSNQYSGFSGNVGIGTTSPSAKLEVVGTFKFTNDGIGLGKILTSDANGNATWQTNAVTSEFQRFGNIIRNTTDSENDDFLFGSTSLEDIGPAGDSRMFFDKSIGAFRAGVSNGSQWDSDNLGDYSTAMGLNTTASGDYSFAAGNNTEASGEYSIANGFSSEASGNFSTALGAFNIATVTGSTAIGYTNTASGTGSTAIGRENTSDGFAATTFGLLNSASGSTSTAFGRDNSANGNSSTAWGWGNVASSFGETVSGVFATNYTPNNTASFNASDRLFTIGNGTGISNRSNAMVVLKNGNTGFGTSTPSATLDVEGTFQLVDGNEAIGKVLTSDANGNATWQNTTITGTDADWVVSGSNQYSGVSGNVGIGTSSPSDKLVVSGGRVEFTATTDASGNPGSGVLEIANSLRLDGNEIITNTDEPLYIQNNNNGDFVVDDFTFMVDASTNNVGIGTNAPTAKLEVADGRVVLTATTDASGTPGSGVLEIGNSLRLDGNEIITNDDSTLFLQRDNNGDLVIDDYTFMVDASANNVGIGTNAPTQAKLVVNGSDSNNIANHAFFNFTTNTGFSSSTKAYSIYASHNIATAQLNVFSDARIKNITGVSNTQKDLQTLAKIKITNYTLKDSIGKGSQTIKKVIAQQVKEVYPQAVSNTLTDVIPNIYQLSDITDGWITLKTDLKVGDNVKLIFSENEALFKVTEISANAFKVNTDQVGKVFVYGKEVHDFHTVDYDAISMLNVSATQELLKKIEQLEIENSNLKADITSLNKNYDDLKIESKKQEFFLNELDKRLQKIEINRKSMPVQLSK
jgi:hypothetical protein